MRKIIVSLLIVLMIGAVLIFKVYDKKNESSLLRKITVAEVAHSVFYAPQYLALSLGYFEDEGLDVDLVLASGADAVMAAVLSGDADIGFSGTEATIYVYNGGEKDYVMTFAGLTQKDGSFLVSREKIDNFTVDMLKDKYIIGGRKGVLVKCDSK
jgi:NitT/TauT family transport system substrate-binding protein